MISEKIWPHHLERKAILYVRQSCAHQVLHMGVDDEGDPDEVPVPAGDLEPVRTPAKARAHDDDFAVVDTPGPAARVPGQQHSVLAHDVEDAFVVDGRLARPGKLPVRQGRDTAVAISRALVDKAANELHQGIILLLAIGTAGLLRAIHLVMKMAPGHSDRLGNRLHREPPLGCDKSRKLGFMGWPAPPERHPLGCR